MLGTERASLPKGLQVPGKVASFCTAGKAVEAL